MELGSGAFKDACSFGSRFGGQAGMNPEELIGAAYAGCFSMALALGLGPGRGRQGRLSRLTGACWRRGHAQGASDPTPCLIGFWGSAG